MSKQNAFNTTGPSTVSKQIKQPTVKQMTNNAKRINREAPLCVFIPPEHAQKLRKASI